MPSDEEMDNMPIWQDHEQRITTLEVTIQGLSHKMDSVERTIREGNEKQENKLDEINQKLFEEFFHKKRSERETRNRIVLKSLTAVFGGGGFLYLLIEFLLNKF